MQFSFWAIVFWAATGVTVAVANTSAQDAMRKCSDSAGSKQGAERKNLVSECLAVEQAKEKPPERNHKTQKLCESTKSSDMVACSAVMKKEAETRLSQVYEELRAKIRKRGDTELEKSLVAAHREWVKFRDAHCDFDASIEGTGNSYWSARMGQCEALEGKARTEYLRRILRDL
jgi:uncharacterized protein YecT (DUF1311 family)